jgi:hypothetical protein
MPTTNTLSLAEFKTSPIGCFDRGPWSVEYHDRTHLAKGKYVSLGKIEIDEASPGKAAFFCFHPTPCKPKEEPCTPEEGYLESCLKMAWAGVDGKAEPSKASRCIVDQLGESLARLGLLQLGFEIDDSGFRERRFAVVILDTNALRNGAIRHLKEQFGSVQLWTIIPLVSLMEIGERSVYIARRANEAKPKRDRYSLLRVRPQVTVAPLEVEWIKAHFPVETMELPPELLRTFRGYEVQRGDEEPDRVSINDRLILEGIKDLRRQRALPEGVYLISGDKGMARLARLEGIRTVYPATPSLDEFPQGVYSARYSLEAHSYIICSVHHFLWDLAHVFSKIRAVRLSGPLNGSGLELSYYCQSNLVNGWISDRLEVTDFGPSLTSCTL